MRSYFRASVVALAIAMLTGVLFRGMITWGWELRVLLGNVRHAHSHLMFFGWVSPAIMAMIAARVAQRTGRAPSRAMHHAIGASLVLGIASWPFFLTFGYSSVAVGHARIPPSVIVAGLAILGWYAFAIAYARASRGLPRRGAVLAWDLAVAMLCLSSIGAWSLAVIRPLGLDPTRFTPIGMHAFLDPFSEGWLVLAVLGLMRAERDDAADRSWGLVLIALGASFAFALAAPRGSVPEWLRWLGAAGGVAWSIGALRELALAMRKSHTWPVVLGLCAALARLAVSATPWVDWMAFSGLRLVYLHSLLLGFVSLGLLALARSALGVRLWLAPMQIATVALIASLVPLSEISPWRGVGPLHLAFVVALVPPIALVLAHARPWSAPWLARRPSAEVP